VAECQKIDLKVGNRFFPSNLFPNSRQTSSSGSKLKTAVARFKLLKKSRQTQVLKYYCLKL
jgi:hypothetical protein